MSSITGKEPAHWHRTDANGTVHHNMNDPRNLSVPPAHWTTDERAYVAHLEGHRALRFDPTPREDDAAVVRAALEWIASQEKVLETLRGLVGATREELAQGVAPEDSAGVAALRRYVQRTTASVPGTPPAPESEQAGGGDHRRPVPATTTEE